MNITTNTKNILSNIKKINSNAKLVVVGKKHSFEKINQAIAAGTTIIAENKWQEAKQKLPGLSFCEKHFIGHLQTNKVKHVVKNFDCIQSIDSLKLAMKINTECEKINKIMPVMIEINISYDINKYGVVIKNLDFLLPAIKELKNIKLIGFMAITAIESDEKKREDFQNMKQLFDKYKDSHNLSELSMGMSSDYELALEYGATMVRVGSAIFT